MKSISTYLRVYLSMSVQRLTEILYVPTQTGSHELGDQYLGDITASYVEHKNFPDAGRSPFRRVVLQNKE
jgi:hypothetical protein